MFIYLPDSVGTSLSCPPSCFNVFVNAFVVSVSLLSNSVDLSLNFLSDSFLSSSSSFWLILIFSNFLLYTDLTISASLERILSSNWSKDLIISVYVFYSYVLPNELIIVIESFNLSLRKFPYELE